MLSKLLKTSFDNAKRTIQRFIEMKKGEFASENMFQFNLSMKFVLDDGKYLLYLFAITIFFVVHWKISIQRDWLYMPLSLMLLLLLIFFGMYYEMNVISMTFNQVDVIFMIITVFKGDLAWHDHFSASVVEIKSIYFWYTTGGKEKCDFPLRTFFF